MSRFGLRSGRGIRESTRQRRAKPKTRPKRPETKRPNGCKAGREGRPPACIVRFIGGRVGFRSSRCVNSIEVGPFWKSNRMLSDKRARFVSFWFELQLFLSSFGSETNWSKKSPAWNTGEPQPSLTAPELIWVPTAMINWRL